MKIVYEDGIITGSFSKGKFTPVPPVREPPKSVPRKDVFSTAMHLVLNHNQEQYSEFMHYMRTYQITEAKIKEIIAVSATKGMLKFQPGFPRMRFDFPEKVNVAFETNHRAMLGNQLELDIVVLEEMISIAIKKVMEEEFMPFPSKIVIGKCLSAAVTRGFLPKRFKVNLCGFEIIYDHNIDGIVFL